MKYFELKANDLFQFHNSIYLKHENGQSTKLYPKDAGGICSFQQDLDVRYLGKKWFVDPIPEKTSYLFDLDNCVIDLRKVLWILKTENRFKIVFNCHVEGQNLINIEMKYWEPLKAAWERVVTNDKV